MENSVKKISVIIPAWQAEKYIAQAIRSVQCQHWAGEVEIIVCDDGSTDRTKEIARQSGATVLLKEQGGAASARNMGIKAATGQLLFFLDADDVSVENALECLYAPMQDTPELMAVFGKAEDFISEELTEEQKEALKPRHGAYGGVLPGCALIRREVFDAIGLFEESLKSGETVSWQMKLRDSGIRTAYIGQTVLKRRLHLTNTGRLKPQEEMKNYAALLRERMKK